MHSTLSARRIGQDELESYLTTSAAGHANLAAVALPSFQRSNAPQVADKHNRALKPVGAHKNDATTKPVVAPSRPRLVPNAVPTPATRRAPLVVQANRALRTVLVALCGIAIVGYGLDVAASHDVSRMQDQARRLNEQNSELSANLLQSISYQDIQKSALNKFGLETAKHVVVVPEKAPPKVPNFTPGKHHLPLMAGY